MSDRIKVNIEDVDRIQAERRAINTPFMDDIDWYSQGVKINISPVVIERFKFTGLSNIDFITSGYYLEDTENEKGPN